MFPIAEFIADISTESFLGPTVNLVQILAVRYHRILQSSNVSLRHTVINSRLKKRNI